ncbi:hypothetical protein ACJRO7_033785 [Eucalyptus globulus]|uniref:Deacetylase sirtuin-type domain-containing protein n=1 Tax=Eucalyptus globulus TaxID=34317 RepID=A0ABD3J1U3_EUCGL
MVPDSDPPSLKDTDRLHQLFDSSTKLVVLTGARMSTEYGNPGYRCPNGAYNTDFKPITHQGSGVSYAGRRRFTTSQPSAAHYALVSLEKAGRVNFMITENVVRMKLHHRAGSNPLEINGTVYTVICKDSGFLFCRNLFQEEVKALNPKAAAIERMEHGNPGSAKSFGMKQRSNRDIEIDENFWEEDLSISTREKCVLVGSERNPLSGYLMNYVMKVQVKVVCTRPKYGRCQAENIGILLGIKPRLGQAWVGMAQLLVPSCFGVAKLYIPALNCIGKSLVIFSVHFFFFFLGRKQELI